MLDRGMTLGAVAEALGTYPREVSRVARRYEEGGLQHALTEEPRPGGQSKLDSVQEAALVALVCGPPPEGRARWTVRLLTEQAVKRGVIDSVGRETVRMVLAEHQLKPWREKNVVSSRAER
jgi:transposase